MKVRNLGKRGWPGSVRPGQRNVQMNLLNQEKRGLANPISVSKTKIANESAECREERLLSQSQYQNETRCIIVLTQAFCWK